MKLLLSSLHLASLCALSSYSVSSHLVVTQSEDVALEEGEPAQISCCWSGERERTTVIWKKKQKEVKHEVLRKTSCSYFIIANITREHSGKYICEVLVEIPLIYQGSGNGTVITVRSKNETLKEEKPNGEGSRTWLFVGLAVAALILLLFFCICCRRRRPGGAVRVIYEAPHVDSETQDVDKDSTGSRDSSQWCQVPVYEPFQLNYFEQVEAKKSG